MTQQIVVIGAGIAGLASAVALQRQGHDVSVIESRTDTSTGAGITIWPNALAALDEIGLGDAVRDAGGRMTAGAMRWHDGSWLRHPATETWVSVLGEPLAVVQRSALSDILTGALCPGTIEYGVKADGLVATADGVRIRLADATVRHAAALIGADGIGSTVAHHLNGPLTHRYTGYTAWRGIATCGMDSELGGQTLGPGVEVGHIPMGPDRTYWFTTQRAPEGQLSPEGVASCCGLGGRQLSVVCCRNRSMNLAARAERNSVTRVTAYRWFRAGLLPVSAQRVGRLILVEDASVAARPRSRTAVYARVSSADQKADLDRQVARVIAWATDQQIPVDQVVIEVGSALNGHRRKFLALLRDPSVNRIVVEHRDRFCRFGSEYVQAALAAQGRELVVVDKAEVDDDLVREMTEILTSMCARLYGKRAAANRAKRALAAAATGDAEAA